AIGRSHYDIARAKLELSRLFSSQWQNGMIPHIIFSGGLHYWWDRQLWRSWINPLSVNGVASSGLTQPPMVAEAVTRIGNKLSLTEKLIWYRSAYPHLLAYHLWLYRERDPKVEGLVVQLHPWETGLDNSPPIMGELNAEIQPWWLRFLERTHFDRIGDYFRVDYKYVTQGERSSNIEALVLYNLLRKVRRDKYDSATILKNPSFAVQDITYNSILIRANTLLREIADTIGEKLPQELLQHTAKATSALESLWDGDSGEYYTRQYLSGKLILEPSIGTFLPLYSGSISQERATQLVRLMEDDFWFGLKYPIPSAPANSPWFDSRHYWQGPTWVNTNWLIIDGLKRYGFHDQANTLKIKTLEMVRKSGFYEYFDPYSGEGRGTNNFSWTAALTIDLLADS
ncbi:MAG TPA: trehalase family glycosidase, partial [Candidatus Saccharimonadales bacterium]